MYSQEILHSNPNKSQFYVRFSRDFLDVSESIDAGQDLQRAIHMTVTDNRDKHSLLRTPITSLPVVWSDPTEI